MLKTLLALLVMASVSSAAQAACTASVTRSWVKGFTIEATAQGPTCAQAVATLVIRKKSGEPVWVQAYVTSFLMNFSQMPAANSKVLSSTLKDWISGDGFQKSADKLVEDGEFPFTVDEGIDATAMKRYRKNKAPLFCYIQGMESGNCLTTDSDGAIVDLGVQSFPC